MLNLLDIVFPSATDLWICLSSFLIHLNYGSSLFIMPGGDFSLSVLHHQVNVNNETAQSVGKFEESSTLHILSSSSSSHSSACPEYCVCSRAESTMSCNGENIFPFPTQFPANLLRLFLQNFPKNDLRSGDIKLFHTNSTALREIRLPRNSVNVLRNNAFLTANGLKRLDLSENKLSQITNLTFIGLSSLLYLDLSSNRIFAIDPGSFAYLPDLIRLDLNSNKLTKLPNGLFAGLLSLQYLNLEMNQLGDVHVDVFSDCIQLVHLNFAMNPLKYIGKVTLNLPHLHYCDFSHCGLTRIPQNLPATIRDIRLSGNMLGVIERKELNTYKALVILVLDDCNLTSLDGDSFEGVTQLQRLWLNGNKLKEFPSGLPASLKGLYLDENDIKLLLRKDLERLVDLEEIHLRRNKIKRIESLAFLTATHLHLLDLRGNRLEMLNETVFPVDNSISSLDLSMNPVRFVGETFLAPLLTVKQLEMSRVDTDANMDMSIFHKLLHLTTLDLFGSPFLARRFFEFIAKSDKSTLAPKLHTLNVRNCHLSLFDKNLRPFFGRLTRIKLAQNPISCSLANQWLIDAIQTQSAKYFRAHEIKCFSPQSSRDQKILAVNTATLRNESGVQLPQRNGFMDVPVTPALPPPSNELWDFSPETWITILVCCLFIAALTPIVCMFFMGPRFLQRLRTKKYAIQAALSKVFYGKHDAFPSRIDSLRTLYSNGNDSIYTISSEVPPLCLLDRMNAGGDQKEGLYGNVNDALSKTSTLKSIIEYRV